MLDYGRLNIRITKLIDDGVVNKSIGVAVRAMPVAIQSVNYHATQYGVSLEQAQLFIDNAEVMFEQKNSRRMYLSYDGSATVLVEQGRLISAYGKDRFDDGIKSIIEVIEDEKEHTT